MGKGRFAAVLASLTDSNQEAEARAANLAKEKRNLSSTVSEKDREIELLKVLHA